MVLVPCSGERREEFAFWLSGPGPRQAVRRNGCNQAANIGHRDVMLAWRTRESSYIVSTYRSRSRGPRLVAFCEVLVGHACNRAAGGGVSVQRPQPKVYAPGQQFSNDAVSLQAKPPLTR